ncbi:carbon-nitrogen family hydrolase [Allostreptomyces psammosilenae]|uniref:Putative amidohydrolase n=1 Tax=Allostreptomyces psammosilenae TaxID=1892865 RepID=A0A853A3P0_9ACTN|nr:carbon-nitrogen family hydrolase [Allostreptomyces psammosilenae]NYI05321.1 putative amidohydrolase [Allostreptomyces psammosilenae]
MRVTLAQVDVDRHEPVADRRRRVADLVRGRGGDDLVVLPELWTTGAFASPAWREHAEPVPDGPTSAALAEAARAAGVWLHGGSVPELGTDGALYNTTLLFSPSAADPAPLRTYRKIHRFGFDRGEAALMSAGTEVVTVDLPRARLGVATCYDLRFPELFRLLTAAGAQLVAVCAGWPASRAEHWRVLARARAIENQVYVLACGSAGSHYGVRQTGHSMVVDPWGEVVAEAGEGEELLTVEIDLERVAEVRRTFPVLRDRVLGLPTPE